MKKPVKGIAKIKIPNSKYLLYLELSLLANLINPCLLLIANHKGKITHKRKKIKEGRLQIS